MGIAIQIKMIFLFAGDVIGTMRLLCGGDLVLLVLMLGFLR